MGILPSNFVSTVPIPVVKHNCQNQHRLLDVMDSLPNTFLSREHGYALRNELVLPSEGLFYLHFQHLQSGLVCSSILSEIRGWKLEVNSDRLGTCQCGQLSGLNWNLCSSFLVSTSGLNSLKGLSTVQKFEATSPLLPKLYLPEPHRSSRYLSCSIYPSISPDPPRQLGDTFSDSPHSRLPGRHSENH